MFGTTVSPLGRLLLMCASGVAVLAGMRVAAPVIGPVLIALLMTIAWSPGSLWLRKRGWPPTLAALTGILIGVVTLALIVLLVWSSAHNFQDNLPEYQSRFGALRDEATALLERWEIDSSRLFSGDAMQPSALAGRALRVVGSITSMAGAFSLLVFIMAFMMIEAMRYPQKLFDAIRSGDTSTDDDSTAGQLDRFVASMRSYIVLNSIFGFAQAVLNTVLLLALGVDFAIMFGVLSFFLSFLPNVGFVLALVPPALLALLQFGVVRTVLVLVGYFLINTIVDSVIKPRFVGESLDLSPAVVILSLVFWGWLLGPVGALLAVPLSIAAKFFFESFDEVRWLAHLMSDQDAIGAADQ